MPANEDALIRELLEARTIAVIGLSADESKPSHYVSRYMQDHGYRVLPVNPALDAVLGEKSYPSLADLPVRPGLVNVFRPPRFIPAIVDEMIALHLPALWLQQGIVHPEAAARAQANGIRIIMDCCLMVEHRRAGPTRRSLMQEM